MVVACGTGEDEGEGFGAHSVRWRPVALLGSDEAVMMVDVGEA
jgi:hypothetical protein